jgi:hypothetical protein
MSSLLAPNIYRFRCKVNATTEIQSELVNERWMLEGLVSGPLVTQVATSLGYPVYIPAILGIFKIPGAITLVVPGFLRPKEWAHAGIVFELSGAVAASHAACGNREHPIKAKSWLTTYQSSGITSE